MAKGASSKKPSAPKCRGGGGLLEGRSIAKIGGSKWLLETAQKAGKFIPVEYREGYIKKVEPVAEEPAAEVAAEASEAEAAEV